MYLLFDFIKKILYNFYRKEIKDFFSIKEKEKRGYNTMGLVHNFNKELSLWFNAHGISNLDFVEGEEFCYYPDQHIVQWGMFDSPKCDNHFQQFFDEYGLEYKAVSSFFLSVMHEVGHHMTLHYFSADERAADIVKKEITISDGTIDTDYWYWELPTEFAANLWAIDYMNAHPEEMYELYELCAHYLQLIFNDDNILHQLADWQADVEDGIIYPLCIEEEN